MKKNLILFVFIVSCSIVQAQNWLDIGLKAAFNPAVVLNDNVFEDKNVGWQFSPGYFIGGKIGYNFSNAAGITFDFLYNHMNHRMDIVDVGSYRLTQNSFTMPLLFRHGTEIGGYSEIGVQLQTSITSTTTNGDAPDNQFTETNYAIVGGFGQYIAGGYLVGAMLGFRIAYTLNDVIMPGSQDEAGNAVYSPRSGDAISSFSYAGSNPLYVGFVLELNFDFGYIVSADCGKSTKFMLFK